MVSSIYSDSQRRDRVFIEDEFLCISVACRKYYTILSALLKKLCAYVVKILILITHHSTLITHDRI